VVLNLKGLELERHLELFWHAEQGLNLEMGNLSATWNSSGMLNRLSFRNGEFERHLELFRYAEQGFI
jgi:hypothetical protein